MREDVISSTGVTVDSIPAPASSAGASSLAVPMNSGVDWSSHGHGSKEASLSCAGSQGKGISISTNGGGIVLGSSKPSCRPWDRGDLLRRLGTFQPLNWLRKPKISSSLSCAQRGWVNVDIDKIMCESCGAYLSFVALSSWNSAEVENAGETFAKQLDAMHKITCPWRGNSCPETLVQFPPASPSALIGGYMDRCDGLLQFLFLPVVAGSAIEQMRISKGPLIDQFLSHSQKFTAGEVDFKWVSIPEVLNSRDRPFSIYSRSQRLISLCGWEPRWLPSVQDCEEHSAQSARDGYSFGSTHAQIGLQQDTGPRNKSLSSAVKKEIRRSPLLDCTLCGATVRMLDFLTVPRPSCFSHNNIAVPDIIKRMGLSHGVSAASGINDWGAADDNEKEQTEEHDEVATTDGGKLPQHIQVDFNLTIAGGFLFTQTDMTTMSENIHDANLGKDLIIGQPACSEVGDHATSYESQGPSSRKRSLEIGGSSDKKPHHRMQQADNIEGIVVDRDGDVLTDERQHPARHLKRVYDSDIFDTYCSPYERDLSVVGPSNSMGVETSIYSNTKAFFQQGSGQIVEIRSARDSTRASSVIAMDTVGDTADGNSMESVENQPGEFHDVSFPSYSTHGNLYTNEMSETNYSNQARQSRCIQKNPDVGPGEIGVSSTYDREEIFNVETGIAPARVGFSFGITAGSVGMCASHEAEIHGADISVPRGDSVVGDDVEPRVIYAKNQGQTGESSPGPRLLDEIVPDEMNMEDHHGNSQEILSQPISVGSADNGSKIDGSVKADSVGKAGNSSFTNKADLELDCLIANGIGPPKEESNYEEAREFDPIAYHNQFCPWVNGNVAAASYSNSSSTSTCSANSFAFCGWQITLDALDAFRSLQPDHVSTLPSESAASLHKDDHRISKLL